MRQEEQMMLAQDKAKNDAMAQAKANLIRKLRKKENRLTIWDNWLK
jgi:hypothetical protein